jgi:LmbE family N-acetylglucosaminyl deacetylase
MFKSSSILALLLFIFASFTPVKKSRTLLAILAHPDDEMAVASMLVKYAKTYKVYLVIATDGRYGARFHYKPGDELAVIRQKESACGCKNLGIEPPVFLGFHDGMGMATSVPEFFKQTAQLTEKLKQKIEELNPDVIITFGPDGDTGHSDHRHIGAITTEIILREGWVKKYPLYYVSWLQKDSDKLKAAIGQGLNTVHSNYFNVQVKFSEEEENKELAALDCYTSQLTAEEINQWKEMEKKDLTNTLHFRRLAVRNKKKSDL